MKAFFSQQFVSKWKWSWWEHKAICSREEEGKNGHDALFQLSNEDDEKLGDTKWAGTHLSSKSTTPTRKVMKTNLFLLLSPYHLFNPSLFIVSRKKDSQSMKVIEKLFLTVDTRETFYLSILK